MARYTDPDGNAEIGEFTDGKITRMLDYENDKAEIAKFVEELSNSDKLKFIQSVWTYKFSKFLKK